MLHTAALVPVIIVAVAAGTQAPVWMAKKSLAAYQNGQPEQALAWARRTLLFRPILPIRASAHQIAGLSLSEIGRLDEAQREYQTAYELARSSGQQELMGRSLTLLASVQHKCGQLDDALDTARQAAGTDIGTRRDALIAQTDILRSQGRWAEALPLFGEARQTKPLTAPFEQKSLATITLGLAWTEAEAAQELGDAERAERAWNYLQQAMPAFAGDRKLTFWCVATSAWILALRGDAAGARQAMADVHSQLPDFQNSRGTLQNAYSMPGRAALILRDFSQGKELWEQYLSISPEPTSQTRGCYYLGECLRGLGQETAARAAYQDALAQNADTYYARAARIRLSR